MGFISAGSDLYDVFLSYAHADNIVHNQWVSDFERYLKEMLAAELARQDESCKDSASQLAILRDKTGFPKGGELEATIYDKVRQSQFLFIFLGSGYLNSDFCLSELDIFRECVGGDLSEALKRLYLVVLDREALERLREGSKPGTLPLKRERLWQRLQQVTQKVIRMEDFLTPDDGLIPVYLSKDHADPEFHKLCAPLVGEFARKLIDRRNDLKRDTVPALRSTAAPIVLGAVPPRLETARAELAEALLRGGVPVETIELADLHPKHTERLRERLKGIRLLVLPFDRFAVEVVRESGAGGHLARLKSVFDSTHEGTAPVAGGGLLWWEPSGPPSGKTPELDEYDLSFIEMIDALPKESRRLCAASVLADELIPGPQQKVTARVWIEWQESDPDAIEKAKELVRERFDAHCRAQEEEGRRIDATLKFGEADWAMLQTQLKGKPDGVVIVYNENKDFEALSEQEQAISNMEEVLLKKMFPGMFYLRKTGMYKPTDDWSVVRFKQCGTDLDYISKELDSFVSRLFDLLYQKYKKGGA